MGPNLVIMISGGEKDFTIKVILILESFSSDIFRHFGVNHRTKSLI